MLSDLAGFLSGWGMDGTNHEKPLPRGKPSLTIFSTFNMLSLKAARRQIRKSVQKAQNQAIPDPRVIRKPIKLGDVEVILEEYHSSLPRGALSTSLCTTATLEAPQAANSAMVEDGDTNEFHFGGGSLDESSHMDPYPTDDPGTVSK